MKAKPILFSTPMIRAIMRDKNPKTQTRRVINPQTATTIRDGKREEMPIAAFMKREKDAKLIAAACAPYQPGDILWVRETWGQYEEEICADVWGNPTHIVYRADDIENNLGVKWRPSIHMPREAARIFLRVTDVRVERVQEISDEDCITEGIRGTHEHCIAKAGVDITGLGSARSVEQLAFATLWDNYYAEPRAVQEGGKITHYESYPWEDITEAREYRGKKLYAHGNPWVFATTFMRTEGGAT